MCRAQRHEGAPLFEYHESALTRTLGFAYRQQRQCPARRPSYGHFLVSTSISIFNKDFDIGWVNGKPYEPTRIDQTLILGTAQSWRLYSSELSLPFHLHMNPFQIVNVKDKSTGHDLTTGEYATGEYAGMKGLWKDTIFVEGDPCNPTCVPPKGVVIEVRTRYARYIGPFVMHCHILPHEDTGMMQNAEVVLPGTESYRPCATACDPTLPSGGH